VVLGILSLKVVVGVSISACDHRVAKREKNPLDLLERLAQRVPGATGRITQARKIFALARKRRLVDRIPMPRAGRAHSFDMRLQRIKFLTDDALSSGREGLSNSRISQHAGFRPSQIVQNCCS